MKQLVQYASGGEVRLIEAPRPIPKPRQVLVRTLASAVSTGTERGNLDFARASLAEKARRRPDLVSKVITKSLQEGPIAAYREASARLNEPFPLGYSSSGVVESLGEGVTSFAPGDLVACSGAKFATHAEYVCVPETMCAPVPPGVDPEEAAFSALAAVVIHGLRRGGIEMGSRVAIVGLGLLGLLGVQIAKAGGATVIGADISRDRCELASKLGADLCVIPDEEAAEIVRGFCEPTGGADIALVTATSKDNAPFVWAAEAVRERGHIVIVGNFPPELPRRYGYDKELNIEFSRAWGPGTYDPEFQQRGHSEGYPLSLVRWTAPLNMRTYLELVAAGSVSAAPLITHRFSIDEAVRAYELLDDPKEAPLGVVISYPGEPAVQSQAELHVKASPGPRRGEPSLIRAAPARTASAAPEKKKTSEPLRRHRTLRLGVIGAGTHVASALMPAFSSIPDVDVIKICAPSSLRAADIARRYGIPSVVTESSELIEDEEISAVVIATRHDTHAGLAIRALKAGKHVWVEKPLALGIEDIDAIEEAQRESGKTLLVGFNRRFSPLTEAVIRHVRVTESSGPYYISVRANPGPLEPGHWVLDRSEGGGRMLSEGCHFFDLACALSGALPTYVTVSTTQAGAGEETLGFSASIEFSDGSLASIVYAGAGPRSFGRERFEMIGTSKAAAVVDFRTIYKSGRFRTAVRRSLTSRKGFPEMTRFFAAACRGEIAAGHVTEQMLVSSRLTVSAEIAARLAKKLPLDPSGRPLPEQESPPDIALSPRS